MPAWFPIEAVYQFFSIFTIDQAKQPPANILGNFGQAFSVMEVIPRMPGAISLRILSMLQTIRSARVRRKPLLSRVAAIFLVSGMVCLAACVQAPAPSSQPASPPSQGFASITPPPSLTTQEPGATALRPARTLPAALQRVEQTPGTPAVGEVPVSLLKEIVQDLAERLKIESEQIEIVKSEQVEWNDGSLGCPQRGMFYTQALVSGYWLILDVDHVSYDYRASDRGFFFLCEQASLPALATPLPGVNHPTKLPPGP